MTNTHQPAYMGMISSIKVSYEVTLFEQLLYIFDIEGGYLRTYVGSKKQNRGYKVIDFGGNSHFLDAIIIMKHIWEYYEGKYSIVDGIKHCWKNANILPVYWECEINNYIGRSSVPISINTLKKDDCDNICNLLETFSVKAEDSGIIVSR